MQIRSAARARVRGSAAALARRRRRPPQPPCGARAQGAGALRRAVPRRDRRPAPVRLAGGTHRVRPADIGMRRGCAGRSAMRWAGRAAGDDGAMTVVDAVVIGAGPNGLVAANVLADAGWDVLVLEANAQPGGAVRTAEVTAPGFRNDLFSAFYPMTVVSPVIAELDLDRHGLRVESRSGGARPPALRRTGGGPQPGHRRHVRVARRLRPGRRRRVPADPREVAAACRGRSWTSLLRPFPPVRAGLRLAAAAGVQGLRELAELALVPLRRFVELEMQGENGRLLFAGQRAARRPHARERRAARCSAGCSSASHSRSASRCRSAAPRRSPTRSCRGSSQAGGRVECGRTVERVEVRNGRAVGVMHRRRVVGRAPSTAVLADCDAQKLFLSMVGAGAPPGGHRPARSSGSSAPRPPSRSTGRCRRRSRGPTARPRSPARCTSQTAWTSSSSRRRSCRPAASPTSRSCSSGR